MSAIPRKINKRGRARPDRQLSKLQREIIDWIATRSSAPPSIDESWFEAWKNSAVWSSKVFNRYREIPIHRSVLSESIKALESRGLIVALKGFPGLGGIRTSRLRLLVVDQNIIEGNVKAVEEKDNILMPPLQFPGYPFYVVNDVAIFLKKHPETIRRYIRAGKLKAIKTQNMHEIKANDLKTFIRSRQ
jgi:hypothetical protein